MHRLGVVARTCALPGNGGRVSPTSATPPLRRPGSRLQTLRELPPEVDDTIGLSTTLTDAWFVDFNRLAVTPEALQSSERCLLERIVPPHAFASIGVDGQTVAMGLAVAERDHDRYMRSAVEA